VTAFDESLRELARNLIDTLAGSKRLGVGLSANQIGDQRRVFIIDFTAGKNPAAVQVFVNPSIRKYRGKEHTETEGCLSLTSADDYSVRRHTIVNWQAQDLDSKPISGKFHDFAARVFQHEVDHLSGIMINQRAVIEAAGKR
jgi:peptide deformylase